jgi:flagellar basal body P-ring formation protein FlgA
MSLKRARKASLFLPMHAWRRHRVASMNLRAVRHLLCAALALCAGLAVAQDGAPVLDASHLSQARELVLQAAQSMPSNQLGAARVEVNVGQLDPRLRLAPCRRTEAYLPAGQRALGRTRVGLRCLEGSTLWNVTLPVTVSVIAPGMVAREALPAGTVLQAHHLQLAEIDWGMEPGRAHADHHALLGRELGRALNRGNTVLTGDLKSRQWFAAGETVKVLARGAGYQVSTDGEALSPGLEGQAVRVRTSGGRIVTGRASGDRQVEVML